MTAKPPEHENGQLAADSPPPLQPAQKHLLKFALNITTHLAEELQKASTRGAQEIQALTKAVADQPAPSALLRSSIAKHDIATQAATLAKEANDRLAELTALYIDEWPETAEPRLKHLQPAHQA